MIENKKIGNIQVITFNGPTLEQANNPLFKDAMQPLLETSKFFLFDLGNLKFIDSSGVNVILNCHKSVKHKGGLIKLCNPSKDVNLRVKLIIEMTGLSKVIETYTTQEQALESFENKLVSE